MQLVQHFLIIFYHFIGTCFIQRYQCVVPTIIMRAAKDGWTVYWHKIFDKRQRTLLPCIVITGTWF